jgi:hypothetical protein
MKKYLRLGLVVIFVVTAILIVQANEEKIYFKNELIKNHIYIEPPGLRAANKAKEFFADDSQPIEGNSAITIHPGWPKTFAYGKGIGWCGPVRMIESDLDGDGKGEIVTTMQFWDKGLIFKENGDVLNSFFSPQTLIEKLSLGDIDNNKKNEIVNFSYENDYAVPFLYVFNWFGDLKFKKNLSPNIAANMPILADLNNDNKDEIIIKSGMIGQTALQILDGSGDIISKFFTRIEENIASIFEINPVIGNFDNDTDLEIVVPLWNDENNKNKTYIEIYNLDGTPVPGWENVAIPDLIYNPVCGDLNGDGQDEIIACGWKGALFILGNDGKLILNKSFSNGQAVGSPAIGDINNDGKPEIVFNLANNFGPTSLLAIDWQGEIVLEKKISNHSFFSPLIGDMDDDGIPDIIFGNYDYIYAFNWQGNDISGFPIEVNGKTGFMIEGPGPSICDIDHDGKIELTYTKDNGDAREFTLNVLDIDSPYNPATMEWPMHQHDPGHSGRYVGIRNMTVTLPNGGEKWTEGSSHAIIWRSPGTTAKVNIDCSTNKGGSWTSVVAGTANSGSYAWTVPNTPSTTCLIRISNAAKASDTDVSNSVFSILMNIDLLAERREVRAFSIVRQYGQIQFLVDASSVQVAQYRLMRRQGSVEFVLLKTIAPSELQNNQFQMQDKYLEKDIPYTYRVEAYDAGGQLIGISMDKTI